MSRHVFRGSADGPSWAPRLLVGGGLLLALVVGSVVGYGHSIPGVTYCYTSCSITVSAASSTTSAAVGSQVSFSASVTGGTAPYSYSWNFGDGSAVSTSQNPSHTFNSQGNFNVVLTVHDAAGNTAQSSAIAMTVGAGNQPGGSTSGVSSLSSGELAAIIAGVIIAIVVVIAVVLLVMQRRRNKAAAMEAAGAGYMSEPPPMYSPPPMGAPEVDPTSMEPPAEMGPSPDAAGATLPPPPTSDDIPGPSSFPPAPPPPPPA